MIFTPKLIISLVITFFLSGGIAYAVVPAGGGGLISPKAEIPSGEKPSGLSQFAAEPKTEACPLNGKLYSKSEKALWARWHYRRAPSSTRS